MLRFSETKTNYCLQARILGCKEGDKGYVSHSTHTVLVLNSTRAPGCEGREASQNVLGGGNRGTTLCQGARVELAGGILGTQLLLTFREIG